MSALAILLAIVVTAEPEPAADNPHFDAAVAAWTDERWPEAAAAFARAYELDPRPEYVFARAQALRFAGDCARAIDGYREFIALAPPQGAIDEARGHITTCGGDPDAAPADPAAGATQPEQRTPPSTPAPVVQDRVPEPPARDPAERKPPRTWWRDPAGHVLGWTGLAAAGVGTGFVIEGLARRERGERAPDEQSYRDARRGGASLLHAGIPLASIGGALMLGAVIRFAMVARSSNPRRAEKRGTGARRAKHGARSMFVPFGVGVAWAP